MMRAESLQHQLEIGVSIVAVANVLIVFPLRLVPVNLHADENVAQDPASESAVQLCYMGGR